MEKLLAVGIGGFIFIVILGVAFGNWDIGTSLLCGGIFAVAAIIFAVFQGAG